MKIDVHSLKLFINVIYDSAREALDDENYTKLIGVIQQKLIFPINKSMNRLIQDTNSEVVS